MKVSIITPTFNSEKTVEKTVESILTQTHQNIEHIIVDNLSSDKTLLLIRLKYIDQKQIEMKIISEKDAGISDAFNKGVRAVTGDIVAILNSDDFYTSKETIARVVSEFQKGDVDFVYGDMIFDDEKYGVDYRRPLECPITEAFPYNHPAFFVKKSLYDQVGLFNTEYRYAMDFEWVCRLYKNSKELKFRGKYLGHPALTTMMGGGASDKMEMKALDEVQKALTSYGFFDEEAKRALLNRRFRMKLKTILNQLRLEFVVQIWRKIKWS